MRNRIKVLRELNFDKDKPIDATYMYLHVRHRIITYDLETKTFQLNDIPLNINKKIQLISLIEILK